MSVPYWIKLAAASPEELLKEIRRTIDDLGGIEKAQEALRELGTQRKSNWVLTERFVVAKTLDELLDEVDKSTRKNWEEKKIINKPVTDAPTEQPDEAKPANPEKKQEPGSPHRSGPEAITPTIYLSTLLGLLLGYGAALSAHQLQRINLKELLQSYESSKVPGAPRKDIETPVPYTNVDDAENASSSEYVMTEDEFEREEAEYKSRTQDLEKRIQDETDPGKRKRLQEELKEYKNFHRLLHEHESEETGPKETDLNE